MQKKRRRINYLYSCIVLVALIGTGFYVYSKLTSEQQKSQSDTITFDSTVSKTEKQIVLDTIDKSEKSPNSPLKVSVDTVFEAADMAKVISAYVPVMNFYAVRQKISKEEIKTFEIVVPIDTEDEVREGLAKLIGVSSSNISSLSGNIEDITDAQIALVPSTMLTSNVTLLRLDDNYYLDDFSKGALFRQVVLEGKSKDLSFNTLATKDSLLKVNMTGVTALTRGMQTKLASVNDPLYFSKFIGDYLADADITHVSNEVSFRPGCQFSSTSFCSPPEFIETLKSSGVDVVELTGNHNNDNGSSYNQESISLYRSLGMGTFGGGLNSAEASKPFVTSKKNTNIAFFGYNKADGLGSGAIADESSAGANYYTDDKAKKDIETAKTNQSFVIVDIQFLECYAYPDSYVEFPQCDGTIAGQQETFRKMIDFGADMVIGSSAHQPQTYELYNGKPIYYGLGNLYFDQTQQPGTERGIILTHYFLGSRLLQTKLSPTVYNKDLQTRLMTNDESLYLLERLRAAR